MTNQEAKTVVTEQSTVDKKRLSRLKVLWPAAELGGGFEKAFFSVYIVYLFTDVYHMSVLLSGTLLIIQNLIGWVGGPLFGTLIDRFSFKKAKFYPWIMIGSIIVYGGWMLLFIIPALGVQADNLAVLAFIVSITIAVFGPMFSTPYTALYPLLSKDPQDRAYFATAQKVARDGGKTIFGYLVPIMLGAFTLKFAAETSAYAITGLIIGVITISFYWLLGLVGLRNSYVERNAVASSRDETGAKKENIPFSLVIKTVFTNKALLSMFSFMATHKTYFFLYVTTAVYLFTYVYNGNFAGLGLFFMVFNLSAVVGVLFGPIWRKIFKETKLAFVACGVAHLVFLVVIAIMFKNISANVYIILIAGASFFAGMLETFILPMFAASADFGAWKSGSRLDGITMSVYGLSIITGYMLATVIRTWIMQSVNYDAVIQGAAPTQEVLNALSSMHSIIPLILGVLCIAIIYFFFPLNDKKLAIINKDLKEGRTARRI